MSQLGQPSPASPVDKLERAVAIDKDIVERTKTWMDVFQDGLNILRDLFLLALLIGLLFFHGPLNSLLAKAGIEAIHGGFFEWRKAVEQSATQNKVAAQASTNASDLLEDVNTTLTTIAGTSKDPAIKQQAQQAANKVTASIASLNRADTSLAQSLVAQQGILQNTPQSTSSTAPVAPTQGWLYIGKTDAQHLAWITPAKTSAPTASPVKGQVITLNEDLYLRADKSYPKQTFNQATILGAARAGSTATVIEDPQYSPAHGDFFVWVKVAINGNQ